MRDEVSQARPSLVHAKHVLLGLSRMETFSEISILKKTRLLVVFFLRNPLPGSDSARHLEPDALTLMRFGAVRAKSVTKRIFLKK